MLITDTEAAGFLIEGELLEETMKLFKDYDVVITPKIGEELEKPLENGSKYLGER